jgi:uncharacterized protein (DUF1697 family)
MKYVALFRGINVGGKSKAEMSRLKAMFESNGSTSVYSYINSGNIIFKDDRTLEQLGPMIEKLFLDTFGFRSSVQIIDSLKFNAIAKKIPKEWTNDKEQKTDVLFLDSTVNSPEILNRIVINPEIENIVYTDGALIWNVDRAHIKQGSSVKLIKSDMYSHMTIRNCNTVRTLSALL